MTFLLDGGDQFGYVFFKTHGGRTSVEKAVDDCATIVGVATK